MKPAVNEGLPVLVPAPGGYTILDPVIRIASGTNAVTGTISMSRYMASNATEVILELDVDYDGGAVGTPETFTLNFSTPNGNNWVGIRLYADDQTGYGRECWLRMLAGQFLAYESTVTGGGGGNFTWTIDLKGWR